jgi:hypothetical protein
MVESVMRVVAALFVADPSAIRFHMWRIRMPGMIIEVALWHGPYVAIVTLRCCSRRSVVRLRTVSRWRRRMIIPLLVFLLVLC